MRIKSIGTPKRVARIGTFLASRHNEILLLIYPWLLIPFGNRWLSTQNNIDSWFYSGFFKMPLRVLKESSPDLAMQYYDTRLPFILLGNLFYSFFPELLARLVFNLFFMYSIIILCVYYLMCKISSKQNAFFGTLLLSSNVYFIRSIGSDYIDRGVLFYLALSLVFLSKWNDHRERRHYLAFAGFFITSMLITYPGAIFLIPLVIGFLWANLADSRVKLRKLEFVNAFLAGIGGMIFSALLFQAIYWNLIGKFQFIFLPSIAQSSRSSKMYESKLDQILNNSPWNVFVFISLVVAFFMTPGKSFRNTTSLRRFWIISPLIFVFFTGVLNRSVLNIWLSGSGLYISFIILFVALSIQASLFKQNEVGIFGKTFLTIFVFGIGIVHISVYNGRGLIPDIQIHRLSVVVFISICLFLISMIKISSIRLYLTVISLAVTSSLVTWDFDGNRTVDQVHNYIQSKSPARTPFFYLSSRDFESIPASFSIKGWWKTNLTYPDCLYFQGRGMIAAQSTQVVIDRNQILGSDVFSSSNSCFRGSKFLEERKFEDSRGSFYVALLKSSNSPEIIIPGSKLPTLIGKKKGSSMIALQDGQSGVLTFGPYLNLAPGRYEIVFQYRATERNTFDVIGWNTESDKVQIFNSDSLPTSSDEFVEYVIPLNLSTSTSSVEARTYFGGVGIFEVANLRIRQLS